jgi:hypothetical protein
MKILKKLFKKSRRAAPYFAGEEWTALDDGTIWEVTPYKAEPHPWATEPFCQMADPADPAVRQIVLAPEALRTLEGVLVQFEELLLLHGHEVGGIVFDGWDIINRWRADE